MPSLQLSRIDMPGPIGSVLIVTDEHCLVALEFGEPEERLMRLLGHRFGADVALTGAGREGRYDAAVRAYFAGDFAALAEVPVNGGGTPFQRRVWAALREIRCHSAPTCFSNTPNTLTSLTALMPTAKA